MKTVNFAIIIATLLSLLMSCENKKTNSKETTSEALFPAIQFKEESYDFGKIKEGDVVSHVFSFVNSGQAPLIISQASTTCGCTVPEWTKEPVPVGGKGTIQVEFDSSGKRGTQNKVITLTANTKEPTISKISISAEVEPKEQ